VKAKIDNVKAKIDNVKAKIQDKEEKEPWLRPTLARRLFFSQWATSLTSFPLQRKQSIFTHGCFITTNEL
jgi:hypothetical protein